MTIEIKNAQEFKDKIFEYDTEKEWKFKGDKPAICDFAAEWCGPCKVVGPILEELSGEYEDKLDIYKIDVDAVPELSQAFGIQSIPSILFIPINEQPQMTTGAMSMEGFKQAVKEVLKVSEK